MVNSQRISKFFTGNILMVHCAVIL